MKPPTIGLIIIIVIAGLLLITALTIVFVRYYINRYKKEQSEKADSLIQAATEKSRTIEIEARDKALKILQESELESTRRRQDIIREDDRQQKRRAEMDHRIERLELREQNLNKRQSALDKRANEIEKLYTDQLEELQRIGQMSMEDAKQVLLSEAEKEARNDMARIIRQIEAEARADGDKRAREIITDAIQRVASEHVVSVSTSLVTLPNEEMKGRIVGRNGRNIRAFEQAAGVDVIVDDTPEAVTISCFDPVRREIARRSLDRLIVDGRIHPAHIEKILAEEEKEVEKAIVEAGEEAAFDAGVAGIHPEILKMLGRLKFRTSYGQNQLAHAVEVSKLSAVLAAELGADVEVARTGGLLHDLGKAMDHNTEGTHAQLGADFARRYGVNSRVVNAMASHHHEVEQESIEAVIIEAADAISGARPGARREDLEQYIKRLRALEEIANSFKGVQQQKDSLALMKDNAALKDRLGEDTYAKMIEQTENPSQGKRIVQTFVSTPLFFLAALLLQALLLLTFGRLLSTQGTYVQVLAVLVHASFIDKLLGNAVRLALALTRKSLMQTSTGLALLFPRMEVTSTPYIVLAQVDLFQLWMFGVLALGLAAVFKIGIRKALALSYGLWFLKALANIGIGVISMSFLR